MAEHIPAPHSSAVKVPVVEHTAKPPPLYPISQVTRTLSPVTPIMEPEIALFELATVAGVQDLAEQETAANKPLVPHAVTPPPS